MKNVISFLKICPIFFFFFSLNSVSAQILAPASVSVESNFYSTAEIMVLTSVPLNSELVYFGSGDSTTVPGPGVSPAVNFQSVELLLNPDSIICGDTWNCFWKFWQTGSPDTLVSNTFSWSFPCPGQVTLGPISVTELQGPYYGSIEVSIGHDMGNALGDLFYNVTIGGVPLPISNQEVFGSGTFVDTLYVGIGNSYLVENFQAINIGGLYDFEFQDFEGVIEPVAAEPINAELVLVYDDADAGEIEAELQIATSGYFESSFNVMLEKLTCDGEYELYDEEMWNFFTFVTDSIISLSYSNLPVAPGWRLTLSAVNPGDELSDEILVDFAIGIVPTVSMTLVELAPGQYEVETTYNSFGVPNVVLEYFVDGESIGAFEPTGGTHSVVLPDVLDIYEVHTVEVVLTSNACTDASDSETTIAVEFIAPYFTTFDVNWDPFMIITVFTHYQLGSLTSAGLRIYHDGPSNPVSVIYNQPVSNDFTAIDYTVTGYGTHMVWIELYDLNTNEIYQTTGTAMWTYQQPVGIAEIGQTITRFDSVTVYDLSGRVVAELKNGETLSLEASAGVYLCEGRKENQTVSSKIYLGR